MQIRVAVAKNRLGDGYLQFKEVIKTHDLQCNGIGRNVEVASMFQSNFEFAPKENIFLMTKRNFDLFIHSFIHFSTRKEYILKKIFTLDLRRKFNP